MSAFRLLRTHGRSRAPQRLVYRRAMHTSVSIAIMRFYRIAASTSAGAAVICGSTTEPREEIRRWAFGLLRGISFDDLDTGYDDGRRCHSLTHGPKPSVRQFDSLDEEFAFVLEQVETLKARGTPLRNICIVARTNRLLDEYVRRFLNAGIRTFEIKRSTTDDRSLDGVRLATMHRVKGLEFDHVFVVAVNKDIVPHPNAVAYQDEVAVTEGDDRGAVFVVCGAYSCQADGIRDKSRAYVRVRVGG